MKKIILILGTLLAFIDQIIKYLIIHNLEELKSVKVIQNFFYLTYVKNDGAAFSILSGQRWILIVVSIISFLLLLYYIYKDKKICKLDVVSYSLFVGGILGNLIDRVFYGKVIDYLDFYIFGYDAPIFNFADMCIVIGALIILYSLIIRGDYYEDSNSRKRVK